MAAISETIVREYFELHEFLVRQFRKYVAPAGREDEEFDFLALNPAPVPAAGPLPFVLTSEDLRQIDRAIVVVKAWHTEVFSPSLLGNNPDLFAFLDKKAFRQAVGAFGRDHSLVRILVIPALPHEGEARDQSIAMMKAKGIDAVVTFRTLLGDLVKKVEPNRNYQKSDLLQMIRILKNYEFFREPQLELFKSKTGRRSRT